jgi:GcrA cell cycle regulator
MEWTAERIEMLTRLRDDGASYAAIAAKLGITRGAVSGKVDRLGLATRAPAPRGPRQPRVPLKRKPGVPRSPDLDTLFLGAPPAVVLQETGPGEGMDDALWRAPEGQGVPAPADLSARKSRACSLLELTEDTCRWPVGDAGEPDFYFCGHPPLKGRPYCGPHYRKAFRPFDARSGSEFVPDREAVRVLQPDNRFGQFADWDVT